MYYKLRCWTSNQFPTFYHFREWHGGVKEGILTFFLLIGSPSSKVFIRCSFLIIVQWY